MQHFQPILIVIGILAIAAVLIHGYMLNRKTKAPENKIFSQSDKKKIFSQSDKKKFFSDSDKKDMFSEKMADNNSDGIVGDVRIIRANEMHDNDFLTTLDTGREDDVDFSSELSMQNFPNNSNQQDDEDDLLQPLMVAELHHISDEMEDDLSYELELKNSSQYPIEETQDIFIFNVVAREEGDVVRGHELLQFFLTAGLRFGEMSIFHRHLHSDGTGPILFSVANMMAPGIFDPEKMEQFRSEGVSFFLTVPNKNINIKEAFDMMLVAVEQMTEEFDCVVLNAEREPLTEQQFRNYHERLLRYI